MMERPFELQGVTRKFVFDHMEDAIYITINFLEGEPHELFINSKDPKVLEWSSLASRLISAIFRNEDNPDFVFKELQEMFWVEPFWYNNKQYNSILAVIGEELELICNTYK